MGAYGRLSFKVTILAISRLISTLELRSQLWTYTKTYIGIFVVTLKLTFDLVIKVNVTKCLIFQLILTICCLISTLEFRNQLCPYTKTYIWIFVVTLNLTFDLAIKVKVTKLAITRLISTFELINQLWTYNTKTYILGFLS